MGAIFTTILAVKWLGREFCEKLKHLIVKIVEKRGSLVVEELDKGLLEMRNTPGEHGKASSMTIIR